MQGNSLKNQQYTTVKVVLKEMNTCQVQRYRKSCFCDVCGSRTSDSDGIQINCQDDVYRIK